jgi:hypothetical protein
MLLNLVKLKDEEIKQLKRQLGVAEFGLDSPARSNSSPLRPSLNSSGNRHDSLRPIVIDDSSRLEDQLQALNNETLEDQVK